MGDSGFSTSYFVTLSDDAIEHVLGCKIASEAWLILEDKYATVSKSRINMLKTEFQTLQRGSDSIDKFLSRLKSIRDQLLAAGEHISENDFIIVALAGLPKEYAIIRTVILACENTISLKEFLAQLLKTKRDIETMEHTLSNLMAAMYVQGSSSKVFPNQGCHAPIPTYVQDRHVTSPSIRISNIPHLRNMYQARSSLKLSSDFFCILY
ncbi:uncharacterized protein LOC126614104, partial [Malus sylvestris]|uniref:uncharacterized protein LOC126614104 n=1 Tax=Malus sylvestris TaxID=3752 RepID=UPI0021ABDEEB